MFKKCILFFLSALWIPAASLAAQTTLNFQNSKSASTTQPGAPIPPTDFQNQVKATNTQNHAQFKQQLDQRKNELSQPKIPSLSQVQNLSQTQPPASSSEDTESTSTPSTTRTKSGSQKPMDFPTTPSPAESAPEVMPAASPNSSPPPLPSKPSQQSYTGFPTQSQPSAGTTPKNNGGFQVQY